MNAPGGAVNDIVRGYLSVALFSLFFIVRPGTIREIPVAKQVTRLGETHRMTEDELQHLTMDEEKVRLLQPASAPQFAPQRFTSVIRPLATIGQRASLTRGCVHLTSAFSSDVIKRRVRKQEVGGLIAGLGVSQLREEWNNVQHR